MIPKPMQDDLLKKIPQGLTFSGSAATIAQNSFGLAEKLSRKEAEVEGNRNLTAEGKRSALRDFIKNGFAKELGDVGRPARKAMADAKAQRDAFGIKPIDRTDIFAEQRRQEIRTYVRSQTEPQRVAAGMDPEIAEALLSAHPRLSGLPQEEFDRLRTDHIEALHGSKLKELSEIEDAYSVANAAVGMARFHASKAAGLPQHEFNQVMAPFEAD